MGDKQWAIYMIENFKSAAACVHGITWFSFFNGGISRYNYRTKILIFGLPIEPEF